MIKVASVQANVVFGDPIANAAAAAATLERLRGEGVQLAVFPEAFLTGYCVASHADAEAIAIPMTHSAIKSLMDECNRLGIMAVIGFAEADGRFLHNSAVLLEPGEQPRFYRKTHLPELGLDRFVVPGRELPVFETQIGRIGILICFDQRAPEPARVLALAGAEVIVLPTNWPEGAETSAEHVCIVRAAENRVFFITSNRVGEEAGFRFIGGSKIIDPTGRVLAAAGATETVIISEIDLSEAKVKRTVNVPGEYEFTVFESRRPELYKTLV